MNPFHMFKRKSQPMATICTNCHKEDGRAENLARRVGGAVGGVAGAAAGVSGILSAARLGFIAGAVAGPAGSVLTAIAAATLRGCIGGTIGLEIGAGLGGLVDKHVLRNDTCRHCGFPHDQDEAPQMSLRQPPWPSETVFPMGHSDDNDPEDELPDGTPIPA